MCASLQESRFVFMLYMRPKLDLCLDASELTGLIKRYRMGTVQDVISGLQEIKTQHPISVGTHGWRQVQNPHTHTR